VKTPGIPTVLFTRAWGFLLFGMLACGNPADIDCSYYTDPVCGLDGESYQNDCYAEQAGVFEYAEGACPPIECGTTPVCGSDGKSYRTNCFAELSGIQVYLPGSCPFFPCGTDPVCGVDGVTYASDCFAKLSGAEKWEPGPCSVRITQGRKPREDPKQASTRP
jgi:hypothetical protein